MHFLSGREREKYKYTQYKLMGVLCQGRKRIGLNGSSAIIVDSQISPVECGTIHDVPHPPFNVYFPHCTSLSLSISPSSLPSPSHIIVCGRAFWLTRPVRSTATTILIYQHQAM